MEDNYLTKLLDGFYNIIENWIIRKCSSRDVIDVAIMVNEHLFHALKKIPSVRVFLRAFLVLLHLNLVFFILAVGKGGGERGGGGGWRSMVG